MRRSCRRSAAAAQHPADRRAQFLFLAVNAPEPTTRPPLPLQQLGSQSLDVLTSRFGFLRPEHPTEPFIAGKRREVLPRRQNLWVCNQDASQIRGDGMHHSAGDDPGIHRSPILAPIRTKAPLGSSAMMPAAACDFGRALVQSIRWAKATMIPSGPRTYAMRQMRSY